MSPSPLLTLPGEIRNQIYALLLCNIPALGQPRPLLDPQQIHPQILSVCRQLHHEVTPILYAHNTFLAHFSLLSALPQLRRWHDPVKSAPLISLIRRYHVYVRLDCDAHFSDAAAAEAFSGVETLTVEAVQTQFGSSDFAVLRRFEGVRGVGTVRITGSDFGFREYARWLEGVMMSPVGVVLEEFEEGKEREEVGEEL